MTESVQELIRRLDCVVVEDARKQSRAPVGAAGYLTAEDVPLGTEEKKMSDKKDKYVNGVVVWPGRDWDNDAKYGGGKRTSATFRLEDGSEVKVNSSNPDSPKALFLKGLKKGQTVALEYNKARGDIPEFYDIDTWAIIGAAGASPMPLPDAATGDALKQAKNRAYEMQLEGIEVARAVAKKAGLEVSDECLFERGGAIGTGLQINLERKGVL